MSRVDSIIKRWKDRQAEKSQWHNHFDDLARILLPRRLGFAQTTITGENRMDDIYDGTPMQAARGLSNSIGGLMRPEGLPKIDMQTEDDALNNLDEVKDWIGDSEERLKNSFNNPHARFRQASGEKDQDLIVFGTAAMFIGEAKNRLLFQTLHLKDCTPFFSEHGVPEGMFIKRNLPIRNWLSRFPEKAFSEETRKLIQENKIDQKIEVLHAVIPREESKAEALFARDLPIADLWIETQAKHEISVGGFHEFPFIVPRWDTASGEDLGRSPGMIALPDGETLQAMGETILIAGQRAADPPLMAPNDGSFDSLNTFPGGLSYYDVETAAAVRGNPFFSLESGTNLPITRDMQSDARDQVFAAFFRNVLNLPVRGPEMTATEVIQRKEEFIREIGPIFGRLETDDTAPTVERAFMIQLRAGGFLPIPEVLQGQNIRFEYDSPVKKIRQQIEAAATSMWVRERIEIANATQRPDILDVINFDEESRFSAEASGIPSKIVNGTEQVAQIREQRQQAEQEALEDQQIQQELEQTQTGVEVLNELTQEAV